MPVRRALAVLLALPVLASIYLAVVLRRGPRAWAALALGVGAVAVVAAAALPAGTIGAPTATQAPLAASALGPAVVTGTGLRSAMIVEFGAPMDPATVATAVAVQPRTEVKLGWSEDRTQLIVEPAGAWRPATYYTITVNAGARDAEGRPLTAPVRAGFYTRAATESRLAATDQLKRGVALDSGVSLAFDRPVSVAGVLRAFRIAPAVPGTLYVASDGPGETDPTYADAFVWEPAVPFDARTSYTVSLAGGVADAEGATVAAPDPLTFTTTEAPSVVRFRPRNGTEDVARTADVSVRFTLPMDRATTKKAFTVEVNGKPAKGNVRFAEDDTVLVLNPDEDFPYGAKVVLRVAATATAADGTPLRRARSASFTVEPKPAPTPSPAARASSASAPRATPKPTPKPTTAPSTRPTSSSWLAAEKYLVTLMNRQRAKVGAAALQYHAGISDRVARPYAKKLVYANVCSHFYGGTVGDRLRAAGYTGSTWGENLGCRYFADPRDAAESLVRFFLSSPTHYANMVARKYEYAGTGLWSASGRLRFVVVFYTP